MSLLDPAGKVPEPQPFGDVGTCGDSRVWPGYKEFSPGDQSIVFERRSPNAFVNASGRKSCDVMRNRNDGSGLKRLSPAGKKALHGIPDWSADNRILFGEWNELNHWSGPVLVNPDGSNYHSIEKLKGCVWVKWIPPSEQ